jgi:transposase InsO family protein
MVELEMLAVVWAVKKCRVYLLGLQHFDLKVDHKPLVPILDHKSMDAIENPRLMRLREHLLPYNFTTEWTKGKEHNIPDALSRAPVKDPGEDDREAEEDLKALMCASLKIVAVHLEDEEDESHPERQDKMLTDMAEAAKEDQDYQQLIKYVIAGFPTKATSLPVPIQPYHKLQDELSVDEGLVLYQTRIVVPKDQRREVLKRLHASHQGIERTKRRARQTVFWPGISADIFNTVGACQPCQERRASLPAEPLMADPLPTRPFQETAADLFYYAGKHFLVYVDRFSGWAEIAAYGTKDPNADMVVATLSSFFARTGVPIKFRSDGGLQFAAATTQKFMLNWGINHVFSAPHFPSSNGLAESAVKSMKSLVASATVHGDITCEAFLQGLLELRNTPRPNGLSPAQMVFGVPLRSCVPAHCSTFAKQWQEVATKEDELEATPQDLNRRPLVPLSVGCKVWLQDPASKRWTRSGTVIQARGRNYHVKMPSGRVLWRNRRHLRKRLTEDDSMQGDKGGDASPPQPGPRRSTRKRLQPQRF